MADRADNDVGLGRRGYRDFVAVLVGLVILAFADAVYVRLMQRINFKADIPKVVNTYH